MYRSAVSSAGPWRSNLNFQTMRWQESLARLLAPLTIWICVSVTIRYGYFSDRRMVIGPSSSCLLEANSLFVSQVEVKDGGKTGVSVYGFSNKPKLTLESNWNVSNYLIVTSYSRKGISLWLNKGSRIHITLKLKADDPSTIFDHLHLSLTKGERNQETIEPTNSSSIIGKEAEYNIEEDDKYYIGITNSNMRTIIMTLNMNVTSKMYDTLKGNNSVCSTLDGSCRLDLLFLSNLFILVTTPNNGDTSGWYIDLSFIPRILSYVVILGFVGLMILLIARYLGVYQGEEEVNLETHIHGNINASETDPLMPNHQKSYSYGTRGDELEEESRSSSCSSSSEDLYDGKICVICYDMTRDCFFVPCGHCATCYECAKRIIGSDAKVCPICRRMIHRVRKLIIP